MMMHDDVPVNCSYHFHVMSFGSNPDQIDIHLIPRVGDALPRGFMYVSHVSTDCQGSPELDFRPTSFGPPAF